MEESSWNLRVRTTRVQSARQSGDTGDGGVPLEFDREIQRWI